jgi:hypothetical protein
MKLTKTLLWAAVLLGAMAIRARSATIAWTNTGGGSWSAAANWRPRQVPGPGDEAIITSNGTYTVALDTGVSIGALSLGGTAGNQTLATSGNNLALSLASAVNTNGILALAGGTLGGAGTLSVNGLLNWSNGSIVGTVNVATNGLVVLAGASGTDSLLAGLITNAGILRLASGNLQSFSAASGVGGSLFNLPGGLVDAQADVSIDWNGSGSPQFLNQGTFRKSGGTGTTALNLTFNNTGALDVQSGTVSVNNGGAGGGSFTVAAGSVLDFTSSYTVKAGGVLTGAGTNQLSNGTFTLNGSLTDTHALLAGATLAGTNAVLDGPLIWTNGGIAATLTMTTNGLLVLEGADGTDYSFSGVLTNAGTVQLASGNLLSSGAARSSGWLLVNLPGALVDVQTDVSVDWNGGGSPQILNQGTFRKSGGTGTTAIGPAFNNTGTLDVRSGTVSLNHGGSGNGVFSVPPGATLAFGGGNYILNSGAAILGGGTNVLTAGSLTLNGAMTVPNWVLNGGVLAVNGSITLSNGVLAGATLSGTNLVLQGVWTWANGSIAAAVTVATNGLLVLAGVNGGDYALSGMLTNAGIVRLVSGNLQSFPSAAGVGGVLVNLPGGLIDVQANVSIDWNGFGSPQIINQGTFRKSGGTGTTAINLPFSNSGTLDVQTGTVSIDRGGSGVGSFSADAGAALDFGASFTVNAGGVIGGNGTNLLASGVFTLNGSALGSRLILAGATLAGSGTVTGGALTWMSGTIAGTLTVATNGSLVIAGVNGTDCILSGTLVNDGTVRLVSGNLESFGAASGTSGTLINQPGGLVDVQADVSIDSNGSTGSLISNQGTFRKSGGTGVTGINAAFNNPGTLDVQTGTVSLNANYSLANGTLNVGINSLTNFGCIGFSGNAALSGTFSANFNGGYLPALGDSFVVVTYDSETGSFGDLGLPPALVWQPNYGAEAFTITAINSSPVIAPVPDQGLDALSTLTVTNSATDPENPAAVLTFGLISAPAGMTIDSTNGLLTWTPTTNQRGATYTVVVSVTDDNAPPASDTTSFAVTVYGPVVAPIPNYTVNPGQTVAFTATASGDRSTNTYTFSLGAAPARAGINLNTGAFSWRPPLAAAGTSNYVQVTVTDNRVPPLTNTVSFAIFVNPLGTTVLRPLGFTTNGLFRLGVTGPTGPDYVLLASTNLTQWLTLSTNLSPATPFLLTDPTSSAFPYRFYRLLLGP